MAQAQTIDVSTLIDNRKLDAFNWGLVILSFFVILSDGFDIGAIAIAAPELRKIGVISSPSDIGWVLSASLWAILIGSPIGGFIGDRYGRRVAIILSCLIFGIFTLTIAWATSVNELIAMRFLAGVGIGGLLPNIIALNAEFAPKRYRATLVILMFCGITFGGAVPGVVGATLMPSYGWPIIFWIGGITPLVMAVLVRLFMPESLKFLVLRENRAKSPRIRQQIEKSLARLNRGIAVEPNTNFVASGETQYGGFSPTRLFKNGLGWITPLLWLCFICNLLSFYFITSGLPSVMTNAGIPATETYLGVTLFQIGGTLGGLTLSRPIDLKGLLPVAILFAIAIPIVGLIGFAATSMTWLWIDLFLAGFCSLGLQFGLNASSALIYPTAFRSNGSGWAFGIGRFGSAFGSYLGGAVLALHLPLPNLYMLVAIPYVVGTVAAIALVAVYRRRFGGFGLGLRDTAEATAAARSR